MEVLHILPAHNNEMHNIDEDPEGCPCCPCVVVEVCTLKAYHNDYVPFEEVLITNTQMCNQN